MTTRTQTANSRNVTSPLSPSIRYVADVLAERIHSGEYKNGQWFPSERALADEFEVSRVIIHAAIKELEEQGLLLCSARCRPLVRTVTSTPSNIQSTAARRSLALWVWPHPQTGTSSALLRGVRQALNQDDFRLVLESAHGEAWTEVQESEQLFLRRILRDRDIEGILLWYIGGPSQLPDLQAVRAAGIPMVFLDRLPPTGFDADYVGLDNVRAAEQVVSHLVSLGHQRIAHVTNLDTASPVQERQDGYRNALRRARISFDPALIAQDAGELNDDYGCTDVIDALLNLPQPPTAIFAVNDTVAFRVLTALRARGRRVPEEMAVAGFDGIERWSPGKPFLTTINQPFERMGARAVSLLLERLAAGPHAPYKHIVLDAPLAVHDSTRLPGEQRRAR